MRYALLIVDRESARPSPEPTSPEEQAKVMKEYDECTEMLRNRGIFLGGEALQPNPTATTVRVEDGRRRSSPTARSSRPRRRSEAST